MKIQQIILTFLLFMVAAVPGFSQRMLRSITEDGARNDGITLNTLAIQRTIDAVHAGGGGVVLVPRGRFLTGVLHLKSNVQLHLHEEAILLASTDRAHYGPSMQQCGTVCT